MKKLLILFMVAISLLLTGCSNNLKNDYPKDLTSDGESIANNFITEINVDWNYYKTVEDIVDATSNIYTGKVTDISFEVIDEKSGKVDRDKESSSTLRSIMTVYTVAVTNSLKGDNLSEMKILYNGGLRGYKEQEQYELLEISGLISNYKSIPILAGSECTLAIGKEYLFCTVRSGDDFQCIINPTQFAHNIDSENAQNIIRQCR